MDVRLVRAVVVVTLTLAELINIDGVLVIARHAQILLKPPIPAA